MLEQSAEKEQLEADNVQKKDSVQSASESTMKENIETNMQKENEKPKATN